MLVAEVTSVFDWVCEALEEQTSLGSISAGSDPAARRLAVRGTVRLALKQAGIDSSWVDSKSMEIVIRRVLPGALKIRGVADADEVCQRLALSLAATAFEAQGSPAETPETVFERLGGPPRR